MSSRPWIGRDEHGGVVSQPRPDRLAPSHWRLDAIYATERPHHPSVSPDGSRVAFVLSSGAESEIYLIDSTGGQSRRLTTDRSLYPFWEDSPPKWSPDGSRIAYTSGDDTCVVASHGGVPLVVPDASLGTWLDDEHLVVIVDRDRTSRLALVAVEDPWPQPFGPSGGDVSGVVATGDGRVITTSWPREDRNRCDIVIATPNGDWKTLVGHPDRRASSPTIHGGKVAYVLEEEEWRAVYVTHLDGGGHELLARADADFGELDWSPAGDRIAAVEANHGSANLVTLDLDGRVSVVGEGGSWQTPAWSGNAIIAVHEGHDTAPRLVRVERGGVEVLYDGAPAAVTAAPHIGFERVVIRSGDGLEFEGFLFKPANTPSPVPAVVYPHGGPTAVYGEEWDGHAQYFLAKGYGWLAINFRGSTTYGLSFERANHDDWGVGDTADCIAAGKYLQGLDWVDPARVAIFGASYGSYMALASLVHPDNPFACAVAKYGDCNILTSWAQGDRTGTDDLERMMGHPSANLAGYMAGSPIHSVERIDKPILIAHGELDARVHPQQAEELVAELSRLDKHYEYVTYTEEAHGFLHRRSQIDFYERLERFLDWHLI